MEQLSQPVVGRRSGRRLGAAELKSHPMCTVSAAEVVGWHTAEASMGGWDPVDAMLGPEEVMM